MRRLIVVLGGIGLLALLLAPATGSARPDAAQPAPADLQRGRALYLQACASCHGPDPAGPAVYPKVPSLRDVGGAAAVDWVLRTGRMPMAEPYGLAQPGRPRFTNDDDIRALSGYVGDAVGDTQIPTANPADGDLLDGAQLYASACAACHGNNGAGSSVGGQNIAPALQHVSPQIVAEAMKIGPGQMPVFNAQNGYGQHEVDSIAAYLNYLRTVKAKVDRGGAPIGGKGPVPEGFVAWVIGLGALLLAARFLGSRT